MDRSPSTITLPCLGITGGIGSGKSTVSHIFASLGVPVYDADSRAKSIMTENPALREGISALLGRDAYLPGGALNRAYISSKVFADPALLEALNQWVHPATAADFQAWKVQQSAITTAPFLAKEAAILFESGAWRGVDSIAAIYAPETLRLARVMARDKTTPELVKDRMRRQWPESRKMALADFLIFNDGVHMLTPQVAAAMAFFREKWSRDNLQG